MNRKNIDIDRITNEAIFTTDSNENVSIEIKAIDKAGNSTDKTVSNGGRINGCTPSAVC